METQAIDLLLSRADDGAPTLEEGLPVDAAETAERPEERKPLTPPEYLALRHDGGDQHSLPEQRWGLLVPEGPEGDRLLELVAPLRAAREEQQGGSAIVFRAPPNMNAEEVASWWSEVYLDEAIREEERPRYLLVLGDADRISWEMQQRLAADIFIGRLAAASEAGYESYVAKVLRHERGPAKATRALYHTVRDGTGATTAGHRGLMMPTVERSREGRENGSFDAEVIEELGSVSIDDFVAAAAAESPTLLFSISHGAGAPRAGWSTLEEMRRLQGAMSFGSGSRLTAEDIASRPFLPGGAWFYFACYGAGTPGESAFHHWLSSLRDLGLYGRDIDAVLRSLPAKGERPFVAALPQAALANPDGPLAVMGHVDLAWSFSFQDVGTTGKYRPARFQDIFRTIVAGKRIGAASWELQRFFNLASTDLSTLYDRDARAKAQGDETPEDKKRRTRKATLWMLRQDLSAYVLLGDPAAYLNSGGLTVERPAPRAERASVTMGPQAAPNPGALSAPAIASAAALEAVGGVDPALLEAAIFPAPSGEALDAIAREHGIGRKALDRWIERYRTGGRAAAAQAEGKVEK
jgi:hypothetical protein